MGAGVAVSVEVGIAVSVAGMEVDVSVLEGIADVATAVGESEAGALPVLRRLQASEVKSITMMGK